MSANVLVVVEHLGGEIADITFEMLAAGRKVAAENGGSCFAALIGGTDAMVGQLGAADTVYRVSGDAFTEFNPESHTAALRCILETVTPRTTLIGHTAMGMDLASVVACTSDNPLAVSAVEISGGATTKVTAQVYGGKMNATIDLGAGPCFVAMAAGAMSADAGKIAGSPTTSDVAAPGVDGRIRFKGLVQPEAGDVDITAEEVLIAIGRGIGSEDGVEVANELAEAMGAQVAASRPIIDAGWLPKSRQIGKSGLKVTPKLYIALGISGAPEHLEGMKGSATIVAVNTDKNAPIFGVAHYGLVADLYEVAEELTEALD